MLGMEAMLASLLGVTPEQMRETVANAIELLASLDARLSDIETKVSKVHAYIVWLDAMENGTAEQVQLEPPKMEQVP